MKSTLEIIRERSNDYEALEETYRSITGSELVTEPLDSPRFVFPLTLSASIVIPAWNASHTIEKCLLAIEHSSFNEKYSKLLQVVVVDDGSVDGTWELLLSLRPSLNLTILRQSHHSRAHAMNAGIKISRGDVIISCDSDMILSYHTIEELVKRHQIIGKAVLVGFRSDIDAYDPRIQRDVIAGYIKHMEPAFLRDNRLSFDWPGWPENMCTETEHFRAFGNGRRLWMPSGEAWGLSRMVYGALFSMLKSEFILVDGYDEDFRGWGWEDTMVGARAVALGNYIIPVYSATGLHISHKGRSQNKWLEAARNRRLYQTKIQMPPQELPPNSFLERSLDRIIERYDLAPESNGQRLRSDGLNTLKRLNLSSSRANYLYLLGKYDEAAEAYANGFTELGRPASLYHQGRALRAAQRYDEAVVVLTESARIGQRYVRSLVELGFSLAAIGKFNEAHRVMEEFYQIEPRDRLIRFILKSPPYKLFRRGLRHASQGFHRMALRDFEIVLMRQVDDRKTRLARLKSLEFLSAKALHD